MAESRAHNATLIAAGRVEVARASARELPGPDAQYDLATAIETHYWPNLVACFAEVRRASRPGGTLPVIAESYRDGRYGWLARFAIAPMRAAILTADEHRELLAQAGYETIEVTTDRRRGLDLRDRKDTGERGLGPRRRLTLDDARAAERLSTIPRIRRRRLTIVEAHDRSADCACAARASLRPFAA